MLKTSLEETGNVPVLCFVKEKKLQIMVAVIFNNALYLKDLLIHLELHFLLRLVGGMVVLLILCNTEAEKEAWTVVLVGG